MKDKEKEMCYTVVTIYIPCLNCCQQEKVQWNLFLAYFSLMLVLNVVSQGHNAINGNENIIY